MAGGRGIGQKTVRKPITGEGVAKFLSKRGFEVSNGDTKLAGIRLVNPILLKVCPHADDNLL
jgi:hypothetical protein